MPYSATIHRILIHTAEMMRLLPETLTLAHFSEVISVNSVVEFEIAEVTHEVKLFLSFCWYVDFGLSFYKPTKSMHTFRD